MFFGLTTKAKMELAAAWGEIARLKARAEEAEADTGRIADAFDILKDELDEARAQLGAEVENGVRLTDLCVRYEETLAACEAAWDEIQNPVKDPSQVIIVDPVGVPTGARPKGQPVSLRRLRRTALRAVEQQAVRRGAVKGPPRQLPAFAVSPAERAAIRGAVVEESTDEEG